MHNCSSNLVHPAILVSTLTELLVMPCKIVHPPSSTWQYWFRKQSTLRELSSEKKKSASRRTSKLPDVRDRPVRPMRQDTTTATLNVHNAWSITFASYWKKIRNCIQNAYWSIFASRTHTEISLRLERKLRHNRIIWQKNEELHLERRLKYLCVQNVYWSTIASTIHIRLWWFSWHTWCTWRTWAKLY